MALTLAQRRLNEDTQATYTATLLSDTSDSGSTVAGSALLTLTLTYFDEHTGDIINSRDGQNVLNANNVTVSEAGVLTWSIQAADTAVVTEGNAGSYERHVAQFAWTSATITGTYEVLLEVQRMDKR